MAPTVTTVDDLHVRVEVTEMALVVNLELPDDIEASRISVDVHEGTLTVSVPHAHPEALDLAGSSRRAHIRGFNPDASGV